MIRKSFALALALFTFTGFGMVARANGNQANARQTGQVAMQPQSNVALLRHATFIGAHAQSEVLHLTIGLKLRNEAQLKAFLQDVQNPASARYHQFLTPGEFTAQYGPTKAQVQTVTRYLKQSGIYITDVSSNRLLIHTAGETRAYEHALKIMINDYRLDGRRFFSTADAPKLPREIAPLVANVLGLNHGVLMQPHSYQRPLLRANGVTPHAAPPASLKQYSPLQIATAYDWPDITNVNNGSGVTIAIVTADSSGLALEPSPGKFWSAYGLPDHTLNVIAVNGDTGATDGMGETLLDVAYSGAMAPGAALTVYVAGDRSFASFADAYNQVVIDNTSAVMTTSWGMYESANPNQFETDEEIFQQAAAQGISMFAAAGDHGSADSGPGTSNADYPSSSGYVTAANGTDLTIADTAGSYGSETAWNDANCFNQGPAATGGAISQLFAEPYWQTGPGVPQNEWRNNSDMAMSASCSHPYLLYEDDGWYVTAGTSAVAPQLAALFAIAVGENGSRLGQSNSLIYGDVNAGHYADDFRDVTVGSNGAFESGTDWDHPTGWGSPKASSLISHLGIQGPKGVVTGTVTEVSSGGAIAGAVVTVSGSSRTAQTFDDGHYSIALPIGTYTITVTDFGYTPQSLSVTISDGQTTTQNFAISKAPRATVSGNVTDGSGHGYGLYAEIKVKSPGAGDVADVWTDPRTGAYTVKLPEGADYTFLVTSYLDGYDSGSATVTNLSGDTAKNFPLPVITACTAPGYELPFSEDFNGDFLPSGWKVTNGVDGSAVLWKDNTVWGSGNYTGGTGDAADADSNMTGSGSGSYATSLVTPSISVASLGIAPLLTFKLNFQTLSGNDALDVDINRDGSGWTTMAHITANHGELYALPGDSYSISLGSWISGAKSIRIRWRYYNLVSDYDWYAQVDDVAIGQCQPTPGGLISGTVSDKTTNAGIVGATVASESGIRAVTFENAADPELPVGYYFLFLPAGDQQVTASARNYSDAEATVTIGADNVNVGNFSLATGNLSASASSYKLHVMVNDSVEKTFTVSNSGTGPAKFRMRTINAPVAETSNEPTALQMSLQMPLQQKHCMHISPQALYMTRSLGCGGGHASMSAADPISAWTAIARYPSPIVDNCMAMDDSGTGAVYSVDGVDNIFYPVNRVYKYDAGSDSWKAVANDVVARERPACAFIEGKLYVVNGLNFAEKPDATLAIYDPASDAWSKGANNPVAQDVGSVGVALDGRLYVIGGCEGSRCGSTTVEVYDPTSNKWSSAAPYPEPISWQACGAIDGEIYCAGGSAGNDDTAHGYAYDPATNSWSPIAPIPYDNWGMAYMASPQGLLISQGITADSTAVTNRGAIYKPHRNIWEPLPNAANVVYRMGAACGFYVVGGATANGGPNGSGEQLPGYSQCFYTPIPWLTMAPASGAVAAGGSTSVTLTFDGTGQKPYTTSKAQLFLTSNDTPHPSQDIPLTVVWDPQPIDLVVSGEAKSDTAKGSNLAYTVTIESQSGDNFGSATDTILSYSLPAGVAFVSASGDAASCSHTTGVISCAFGKVVAGSTKSETLIVKPSEAGTLASTFSVSAREPEANVDDNSVTLKTMVTGNANVGLEGLTDTTLPLEGQHTFHLIVDNAGPDLAADVVLTISANDHIELVSATTGAGHCEASGNGVNCKLGDVPANGSIKVDLAVAANSAGTAVLKGEVSTASTDNDTSNNSADSQIKVEATAADTPPDESSSDGGGGAFGWFALMALVLAVGAKRKI